MKENKKPLITKHAKSRREKATTREETQAEGERREKREESERERERGTERETEQSREAGKQGRKERESEKKDSWGASGRSWSVLSTSWVPFCTVLGVLGGGRELSERLGELSGDPFGPPGASFWNSFSLSFSKSVLRPQLGILIFKNQMFYLGKTLSGRTCPSI